MRSYGPHSPSIISGFPSLPDDKFDAIQLSPQVSGIPQPQNWENPASMNGAVHLVRVRRPVTKFVLVEKFFDSSES